MVAKRIWIRRNEVVHSGCFTHPNVVAMQAKEQLQDFRTLNEAQQEVIRQPLSSLARWEAPPPELFKVNWNVAFSQGDKQMGVGVIIRDSKGEVIAALSQPVMATYDPVSAESMATLRAVEFCKELGIHDFILEGDSLLVVKAISKSNLG